MTVEKALVNMLDRGELHHASVCEKDVEPSEFLRDDLHQGIGVSEIARVRSNNQGIGTQRLLRILHRFRVVPGDDHSCTLFLKQLPPLQSRFRLFHP